MTEANMKRLYDHYVATGNTAEAEKILKIERYAKFKTDSEEKKEEPEKKTKPKKGE